MRTSGSVDGSARGSRSAPGSPGTIAPASIAAVPVVEPQVGLPLLAVLTVAVEAVLRQDRPDVAVEVERRFVGRPEL